MAAALAVADVLQGRSYVHDALRVRRERCQLNERDAALAMEIALGAVRHLLTIRHILTNLAGVTWRRIAPDLASVLYTAAYQVIWMDRVPVFAAVDEAVALTRRLVRGRRAAGLVNAVLRKLSGAIVERRAPWTRLATDGVRVDHDRACAFSEAVLPDGADLPRYVAAAAGERLDRVRALFARLGAADAERACWASQAAPVQVLQRHRLRSDAAAFEQRVRAEIDPQAEFDNDAAYLHPGAAFGSAPLFLEGLAYAQDTTARAAAACVAAQPGERVLDLCAAPGGKSIALALDMRDAGEIVAADSSPTRLERLHENIRRLQLNCILPCVVNLLEQATGPAPFPAPFDAALIDAPCSNSGVIARRPEARLALAPSKLASLTTLQRDLLSRAAEHVRVGGRLVYSTCSIEPEENEQVVAAFRAKAPGWQLIEQHTALPAWGPRLAQWRDGGFVARLIRHKP